jgi:ATP-dependent DNA helicase RecG
MAVTQAPPSDQSLRYVKGVGPHRLAQLKPLDLQTVEDACYFVPRRYEDRTQLTAIRNAAPGTITTVQGVIQTVTVRRIRLGQSIVEMKVVDGSGSLTGVWFNQPYLAQQFKPGEHVLLYGQVEANPRLQIVHPELERGGEPGEEGSIHMGRIVPVYPLTAGIGQRWLRAVIAAAVQQHADQLVELIPPPIVQRRGWPGIAQAMRELHFPPSWEALRLSQERLVFEELFVFQMALAQRRSEAAQLIKPQRYTLEGGLVDRLRAKLPFTLTGAQERVLEELFADLGRSAPMRRLLQGDVGCGKTVVMAFLIAAAVQSGHQAALMAPTELLAEQHARVLGELLGPLGVRIGLLAQAVPAGDRKKMAAAIAKGAVDLAIGTHALIQDTVKFQKLALALIDEQHKFGVAQRAHLARKADAPDVLVVTATPIPRTLALSLYGDLDVSTITELPAGRRPITTRWMKQGDRAQLYALIDRELRAGRQGFIVYPLIDERAARELRAASQMAVELAREFSDWTVELLHGRLKPQVKDETMRAFAEGRIHLLVSTVIVEVGLDVSNATVMVIEHAERFGLAQLHQLRGRIGRGAHPATCVVISDSRDETVRQRLEAFTGTTNGFELAEADLKIRGPGELLGRRQSGWLRFRLADLARDRELLEAAREEAAETIRQDPQLRAPELSALRERLARFRRQPG